MKKSFLLFNVICILFFTSCQQEKPLDPLFQDALENGYLAREGFTRCLDFVNSWLEYADPETGLIPRNLHESKDFWNAKDAAADNYPFMVLTAAILDRDLYEGKMKAILETEQRLTNRWDRLPDDWSFSKKDFTVEVLRKDDIIFGASEYVKDGLLPLTEYIGKTAWSQRMVDILDDIWKNAEYESPFGNIPSYDVEVNGELLQALSRVYWMTGEQKYLDWAIRLGDFYLLGENHPTRDHDLIRLRDHGCEIISGLCELYLTAAFADAEKKEAYRQPIYEMLDRILEVGTDEHGLFYNQVNPITGEILDAGIADTWGYTYNAYYSVYMLDGHGPYRDAVLRALNNLNHYEYYDWERGSADGYADAIESALNLYNREKVNEASNWVDSQIQVMWGMQDSAHRASSEAYQNTGIIEGWHGDGNFARTTIMYCLWKTQGTTLSPWSEAVYFGAINDGDGLKIAIFPEADWAGKIHFDYPRHQGIFNLPLDYPRINQFPEWFTVTEEQTYRLHFEQDNETRNYSGKELMAGIDISAKANEPVYLTLSPSDKDN
jgi:hypothetical protein